MYSIKDSPEDFVVTEIPSRHWHDSGEFLVVKVTKRLMNTEEVAQKFVKVLHMRRVDIAYAGTKDKNALSTQFFSLKNVPQNTIVNKSWPFEVEEVGFTNEPLSLGSLKGNKFKIIVRNLEQDTNVEHKSLFPNFFGPQRFGEHNAEIGKHIVKKDFDSASRLCDNYSVKEFLVSNPTNFVGALRTLPKKILSLFVHAYQSLLFNEMLKELLEEKSFDELKETKLPLIGFGTEENDMVQKILKKEGITLRDFIIREIPDLSSEGIERDAVIFVNDLVISLPEPDELHKDKEKRTLTFTLGKGSYATTIIEELFS